MKLRNRPKSVRSKASDLPQVSVIVPLHRDSPGFRTCIAGCLALDYPRLEVIVVSDEPVEVPPTIKLVLTGSQHDTGPGEKRDIGMHSSSGDYFAFVDDDAVPRKDWIASAIQIFADKTIGAVAGPGLTPPGSDWAQRAGGAFYESWLGSGPYRYRFRPAQRREVDDYPAYNLLVRRTAAEHVKGWGTGFYGGEDTVICLALIEAGWRIVYDPNVVVYHQRRPVMRKHLAQVANVGLHRGYFVKAYPKTSLRPPYFLPTLGTVALGGLAVAAPFSSKVRAVLGLGIGAYAVGGSALGLVEGDEPSIALALPLVALASHVTYGIQFIRGLLTRQLKR